jgi:hypothetical protein
MPMILAWNASKSKPAGSWSRFENMIDSGVIGGGAAGRGVTASEKTGPG